MAAREASAPTHDDLCRLSRVLNDTDHPLPHGTRFRLNEWLKEQIAASVPFYGAQCHDYPKCSGGCGLGCTHEIVNRPPPHLRPRVTR